ncbi:hypothetical protein SNE40_015346 [Patella caerulea]|uniref:Chitin-binding type-2 domain-containing protein n=2 Tax=Patella caerulea TaxID=87958 RepID=A0AAN8PV20_PATCE
MLTLKMFSITVVFAVVMLKLTFAGNCGGVQNKYVCHPSNPTIFQICIGDQMYTMRCPGGLHFNSRTQTCDWPKNAFCGELRQPKKSVGQPQQKTRNPYLPPFQSRSKSTNSVTRRSRGKSGINSVAAARGPRYNARNQVFEKATRTKIHRKKSRSGYTKSRLRVRPTASAMRNNRMVTKSHTKQPKNKWNLVHHPWWAAKSPATRPSHLSTIAGPVQPTQLPQQPIALNEAPVRPGHDASRYTPRKPDLRYAPRAPNSAANRQPPKPPVPTTTVSSRTTKYKPRKTGKCDPTTCQLPDCRCVGTDIPGNISMSETPMMVMLTFDDSVNIGNNDYYLKLFNDKLKNPNDCPHRGTFFVSGDATQYHYVRDLYKKGNEIASHSISHRSPTTWWAHAGYDGYVKEIEGMSKRLAREGKLPREDIKGMRVPFLQVGGDSQYQMLEDYGYLWDSSMVTGHLFKNLKPSIWPFTLDYAPNSETCSLTPCPTKSYPGLWEVPLVRWYGNNKMACAMPDGCTIGPGRKGTLQYLMDNFNRQYKSNKAPLGIFLHASWFRRKSGNLEGMLDFLEQLTHMPDVYVLTVSQVIDWIQHPKPLDRVSELKSWKC